MKDINTGIYFECVEGLEEQNGNSEAVQLVETAEAATTPQAWGAKERGRIYSQEAVATLLRVSQDPDICFLERETKAQR